MNALGSWKLTLSTPVGPQEIQLRILTLGEGFTGRIEGPMGNNDVTGKVSGNALSWVMDVRKPIPVKVTFNVTVDGDVLSGFAKAGLFGKASLTGERLSEAAAAAAAPAAAEPGLVTADFVDPQFNQPYIEIDEQRSEPAPHRYVHGGFRGTDARFSFYLPPKERYQGRFFHNTYPLALSADVGPFPIAFAVATGNLGFTFDSGAYYVQTNLGGKDRAPPADPAISAYRVNAAAAQFSRTVAAQMYGPHRPYGYLFGGSGGAYQVLGSAENTDGVWDGFVAFVLGTPNAIPSLFSVRMHALRVLRQRNKFPGIMDAINPGGSGNPYAGLNEEERAALEEATRLGFPPRGWWNHETLDSGYFSKVAGIVPMLDPEYGDDFWTKPGYLGSDPRSSIHAARFQFETSVAKVIEGFQKQVEFESVPERDIADAHLVILDGPLAGKSVPLAEIDGSRACFSISADPRVVNGIKAGDRVRIDNAWALALQTYQRHQVPTQDMCAWDQYRDADGKPLYPQREFLVGPVAAAGSAGSGLEGHIHGKMIALATLMDIDAPAWQADWYRSKVRQALGERFEDSFALWYIDHAQHDDPQTTAAHAHTVSFGGALQQALRDLSTWVETGLRPGESRYCIEDSQVLVPATAEARGGVQPVVDLKANGGVRADVKAGEPVTFTANIEVPPNAGPVVAAEWDFEGVGIYPVALRIDAPQPALTISATYAFSKPGTYFPVLRATSQREGDTKTAYGRVQNIARVRVVIR
jgi:hypothetical protein